MVETRARIGSSTNGTVREMGDQVGHLSIQIVPRTVVVDHDVGPLEARRSVDLTTDPRSGIGLVETSEFDESPDGDLGCEVDHDEHVEIVSARFDQERYVEDHGVVGVGERHEPFGDHRADRWMDDLVESSQSSRVGEHDSGECGPIECSVAEQNARSELIDDLLQNRLAGLLQFVGDRVGIDDHESVIGERSRDGRLAASYAAGEADEVHGASPYRARTSPPTGSRR